VLAALLPPGLASSRLCNRHRLTKALASVLGRLQPDGTFR